MRNKQLDIAEREFHFGLWEFDVARNAFSHTRGLSQLFGMNTDSVILDLATLQSLVHPLDRQDGWLANFKADPTKRVVSFRVIRPDKTVRHLSATVIPTCDVNGKLVKLTGFVKDTSEEIRKDRQLSQANHIANFIKQCLDCFFIRVSMQGEILEGVGLSQHLGQDIDLQDKCLLDIVADGDRDLVTAMTQHSLANGVTVDRPVRFILGDGSYRYYNVHITIHYEAHDSTTSYLIFAQSIKDTHAETPEQHKLDATQIRAARSVLGWTVEELAENTGISVSTIRRVECDASAVKSVTLKSIEKTFNSKGITFESHGRRAIKWNNGVVDNMT